MNRQFQVIAAMLMAMSACGADTEDLRSTASPVLTCSQQQIDTCSAMCKTCIGGSGGKCTDEPVAAAGTVCRASVPANRAIGGTLSAVCDPAEVCDGITAACPADIIAPAGTICLVTDRSYGPCDLPVGVRMCNDAGLCLTRALPTKMCKGTPAGGSPICAPPNYCDGSRATCPIAWAFPGTDCGGGKTCDATGHCR